MGEFCYHRCIFSSGLHRSICSLSSFVCVRRNYSGNLAFRTTGVEGTHLTLTAILFHVKVKNSLFLFSLQAYEKKFKELFYPT